MDKHVKEAEYLPVNDILHTASKSVSPWRGRVIGYGTFAALGLASICGLGATAYAVPQGIGELRTLISGHSLMDRLSSLTIKNRCGEVRFEDGFIKSGDEAIGPFPPDVAIRYRRNPFTCKIRLVDNGPVLPAQEVLPEPTPCSILTEVLIFDRTGGVLKYNGSRYKLPRRDGLNQADWTDYWQEYGLKPNPSDPCKPIPIDGEGIPLEKLED